LLGVQNSTTAASASSTPGDTHSITQGQQRTAAVVPTTHAGPNTHVALTPAWLSRPMHTQPSLRHALHADLTHPSKPHANPTI
jgi:hypothetical protein